MVTFVLFKGEEAISPKAFFDFHLHESTLCSWTETSSKSMQNQSWRWKFRSQTSENVDGWEGKAGRVREEHNAGARKGR